VNVLFPVAGRGLRLRPHTLYRPKPLIHVAGDTVLGHVLAAVRRDVVVDRAVFVVGHLGKPIEAWVRANCDFDARFVVQAEPLGQAHALALAREHLAGPVLVVFADTIFDVDLTDLDRLAPGLDGAVHVLPVDDPRPHGVAVRRADGTVERLIEKPADLMPNDTVIGVYFVREGRWLARAIDRLLAEGRRTRGEYYLADALQLMIDEGARFAAHPVRAWEDCGTVEATLAAQRYLFRRRLGEAAAASSTSAPGPAPAHPTAVVIPPVEIARGATIARSVVGPYVYVGPGCHIADSVVGPFVSLESDVAVERACLADVVAHAGARIDEGVFAHGMFGAEVAARGT